MSRAEFIPAIGEQFNSVWNRKLKYQGRDGKEYDLKFFTDKSHFNHKFGLQSCYYGAFGVGKKIDGQNNKNVLADKTFKKDGFREMIGWPKDKLLVTDSAGFQIASFKKRGESCGIDPIDSLRWQEANADVAMNLDIPPTLDDLPEYKDFNAALQESVKNFALFEKERKNYDMKLYNVLHGETLPLMEKWYDAVKGFKSEGWAVGMKPPWDSMIQAMGFMFLWEKGEFEKDSFTGVHFFGTSGKHVVPTLVYAASKLQNKLVTYDSSSYNIGSIYRTYYTPFDIGPHISFGDKFNIKNELLKELPCKCPVCNSITDIKELNEKNIYAGTLISLHNMYQYIYYNDILNSLVVHNNLYIDYLNAINISEKTLKSLEFIDYAIEHGVYNAATKFEKWLIPQPLDKTSQSSIYI